jgi:hypothetical protein
METSDKQWKTIYKVGAVTSIIFICGIILDMVVGSVTGGDLAALPQTAIERNKNCYLQHQEKPC